MWLYLLTYAGLSLVVLSAPIAALCLSAHAVLYGKSVLRTKHLVMMNALLLGNVVVIVAVNGNGTVMANAILGYTIVGILLAVWAVVACAFWLAGRFYLIGTLLQRKWLQQ